MKRIFFSAMLALASAAGAFEKHLMRVPDELKPVDGFKGKVVSGMEGAISIPLKDGSWLYVVNDTPYQPGEDDSKFPQDVFGRNVFSKYLSARTHVDTILLQFGESTLFAFHSREMFPAVPGIYLDNCYQGPVVSMGAQYAISVFLPEGRGLDGEIREILKKITLVPRKDSPVVAALAKFGPESNLPAETKYAEVKKLLEERGHCPELVELLSALTDDEETKRRCRMQLLTMNPAKFNSDTREQIEYFDPLNDEQSGAIMSMLEAHETTEPSGTKIRGAFVEPKAVANVPEVKLHTPEEADAARERRNALRLRTPASFPCVGPTADDGFFDALSPQAAIANMREMMRELTGPLEGSDEELFEKNWAAVADYPSPEIIEWIRNASPVASELVRVKSYIDSNIAEYTDTYEEANMARTFGAFTEADSLMESAGGIASSLAAAQKRMKELGAKLATFGEMPDPVEQKQDAASVRKAAKKTIEEYMLGEVSDEFKEVDGEFAAEEWHLSITSTCTESGNKEEWKIEKTEGGIFGSSLFKQKKIFVKAVAQDVTGSLAHIYIYGEGRKPSQIKKKGQKDEPRKDATDDARDFLVEREADGALVKYDGKAREMLKMAKDSDGREVLLWSRHLISIDNETNERSDYYDTYVFRPTGTHWNILPTIEGDEADTVEKRREAAKSNYKDMAKRHEEGKKTFAKLVKIAERVDSPSPYDIYYALESFADAGGHEPLTAIKTNEPEWPASTQLNTSLFDMRAYNRMIGQDDISIMATLGEKVKKGSMSFSDDMQLNVWCDIPRAGRQNLDNGMAKLSLAMGKLDKVFPAIGGRCSIEFAPDAELKPCSVSTDCDGRKAKLSVYFGPQKTLYGANTLRLAGFGQGAVEEAGSFSTNWTAATVHPVKARISPGGSLGSEKAFYVRVYADWGVPQYRGHQPATWKLTFKRHVMSEADAREKANELDAQFKDARDAEDDDDAEPDAGTEEAEAELAFHNENIKFIEGTIARLKKEMANEKDASRREALGWQIVAQESNKIYEQDRVAAAKTGEFKASRTPFDTMCQMQVIESAMREVECDRIMRDEQRKVEEFLAKGEFFKMTDGQIEQAWQRMNSVDQSDPLKAAAQYRKIFGNLSKSHIEESKAKIAMIDDEILKYEDLMLRAQRVKTGCDIALALGGIAITGGAAAGVYSHNAVKVYQGAKYAKAIGCGYIEDGPVGIAKGVITTYSDAVDVAWSAYDGYKEDGWKGALKSAAWSAGLNYGLPKLMEHVNWRKEITFRPGAKAAPKMESPDVKAYKAEVDKARGKISEYIATKNKINTMDEKALAAGKITDADITRLRNDVVAKAAAINADPTAKAILKYEKGYTKIGQDFNLELDRVHAAVKVEFYKDMKAKGFDDVTIAAIRNAASGKSVGMDADWGIKEGKDTKFTRNGKSVSVYEVMSEGQKSWNAQYLKTTGQRADISWENITSHVHPEAYRSMDILKTNGADAYMRNLLRKTSLADAQQIADVSRFKADEMLNGKDFPRLVYVREAARGSAKDMATKFLPAIDAKIEPLKRLEKMSGKHGKAISKAQRRELERLTAARDYYAKVQKTFGEIGRGEMPPEKWDDEIRTITGGRGISETLNDVGDLFKSLVFK